METGRKYSPEDLKSAILDLESARTEEESMLKEHFNNAYESIKPINLITSTIKGVAGSSAIKQSLLGVSLGLASVYFSKKLLDRGNNTNIKKLAGTAILFGITNILARNPEIISNLGGKLINILRKKQPEQYDVIDIEPGQIQQVPPSHY